MLDFKRVIPPPGIAKGDPEGRLRREPDDPPAQGDGWVPAFAGMTAIVLKNNEFCSDGRSDRAGRKPTGEYRDPPFAEAAVPAVDRGRGRFQAGVAYRVHLRGAAGGRVNIRWS